MTVKLNERHWNCFLCWQSEVLWFFSPYFRHLSLNLPSASLFLNRWDRLYPPCWKPLQYVHYRCSVLWLRCGATSSWRLCGNEFWGDIVTIRRRGATSSWRLCGNEFWGGIITICRRGATSSWRLCGNEFWGGIVNICQRGATSSWSLCGNEFWGGIVTTGFENMSLHWSAS